MPLLTLFDFMRCNLKVIQKTVNPYIRYLASCCAFYILSFIFKKERKWLLEGCSINTILTSVELIS